MTWVLYTNANHLLFLLPYLDSYALHAKRLFFHLFFFKDLVVEHHQGSTSRLTGVPCTVKLKTTQIAISRVMNQVFREKEIVGRLSPAGDSRSPNGHSAVGSRNSSSPSSATIVAASGPNIFMGHVFQAPGGLTIVGEKQTAAALGSDLLETPAHLTTVLCQVLDAIIASNQNTPHITSPFHSTRAPPMTVRAYVERVVKYSKCSAEALAVAFLLMCQHSIFSGHSITVLNVHRLVITTVLLGAKLRDDEYYSNVYYSRIGGISAHEINELELSMLDTLGWDLWTSEGDFDRLMAMFDVGKKTPPLEQGISPPHVWRGWWEHMSTAAQARRAAVTNTLLEATAHVSREQNEAKRQAEEEQAPPMLSPAKLRRASRESLSSSRNFVSQNSVGSLTDQFPCEPPTSSSVGGFFADPTAASSVMNERTFTPTTSASPASQQGTPSRMLTKQRFPRQTSNPHFGGNQQFATTTGIDANPHGFPSQPQPQPYLQAVTGGGSLYYTQHGVSQVAYAPTTSPSATAGKKRPKPEHFADYR